MSFSLQVPVPCIRGHFGDKALQTFQTQIPPLDIINLLGHDPRHQNWKRLPKELADLYGKIQRKTSTSRRDSVAGYLEDRLVDLPRPGAFPSISIGMTRPPVFMEGTGDYPDMGILKIDLSASNPRILLDGLGRISGTLEVIENNQKLSEMLTLPVTVFAPHPDQRELCVDDLGQLFFDFNFRVQQIPKAHALRLDQSDTYLILANKLGKSPTIEKHGGMEIGVQSLGKKSKGIVVQQVFLRFVRGACEGLRFQKSNNTMIDSPNLTRASFHDFYRNLELFLKTLEFEMGSDFFGNRESVHLSSVGWQALGLIAHDLFVTLPDLGDEVRAQVIRAVAKQDWSRGNDEFINIGVLTKVNDQVGMSGRGVAAIEALRDYLREKSGLMTILEDCLSASAESA